MPMTATKQQLQAEIKALRSVGQRMSNVCYNGINRGDAPTAAHIFGALS